MASWWQNLGSSTTGSKSRKGSSSGTPYSNLGTPDFVTSTGGTSAPTPSRFGVPDFVQQPIEANVLRLDIDSNSDTSEGFEL